jgi:hypothetical protein
MKALDSCSVCGLKATQYPATIDSWVLNRMTSGHTQDLPACCLNHCDFCNYAGINYRFTRDEENTYYKDYMKPGSDYVNQRGIHAIAAYYDSEYHKQMRRDMAAGILNKYLDVNTISSMVDFGGNTGEMIPTELAHAHRYVVEVETRLLPNGVKIISSSQESGPVDLVMCSHTLEHVSDITATIAEIKTYMRPGSWFYLEVPLEQQVYFGPNYNFHEHINLFTPKCLEYLMAKSGFTPCPIEVLNYKQPMTKSMAVMGQFLGE